MRRRCYPYSTKQKSCYYPDSQSDNRPTDFLGPRLRVVADYRDTSPNYLFHLVSLPYAGGTIPTRFVKYNIAKEKARRSGGLVFGA